MFYMALYGVSDLNVEDYLMYSKLLYYSVWSNLFCVE